jgi:AcrR family transcriptional regulator
MGKARATRQAIIEKAAVIFNQNGYQRTSLSLLAKALGLTKGAIYGHFAGKDDLAVAALRHNLYQLFQRITAGLEPERSPLGKLRALAGCILENSPGTMATGGCPVLNTGVDADDAHPWLLAEVRRALGNWDRQLQKLIDAGMLAGEVRPDAPAAMFKASFIALIEGGIFLAKTLEDQRALEHAVAAIDLLIDTVLARPREDEALD